MQFYRKLQKCWKWLRFDSDVQSPRVGRSPLYAFFGKYFHFSHVPSRFVLQAYSHLHFEPLPVPDGHKQIGSIVLSLTWYASFKFLVYAPQTQTSLSSIEGFWDATLPILERRKDSMIYFIRQSNRFIMSIPTVVTITFHDLASASCSTDKGKEYLLIDPHHRANFFEYLHHLEWELTCCGEASICLDFDDDSQVKPTPTNASMLHDAVQSISQLSNLQFCELKDPSGWMSVFHKSSNVHEIGMADAVPAAVELLRQNENIVFADHHLTDASRPYQDQLRTMERFNKFKKKVKRITTTSEVDQGDEIQQQQQQQHATTLLPLASRILAKANSAERLHLIRMLAVQANVGRRRLHDDDERDMKVQSKKQKLLP